MLTAQPVATNFRTNALQSYLHMLFLSPFKWILFIHRTNIQLYDLVAHIPTAWTPTPEVKSTFFADSNFTLSSKDAYKNERKATQNSTVQYNIAQHSQLLALKVQFSFTQPALTETQSLIWMIEYVVCPPVIRLLKRKIVWRYFFFKVVNFFFILFPIGT